MLRILGSHESHWGEKWARSNFDTYSPWESFHLYSGVPILLGTSRDIIHKKNNSPLIRRSHNIGEERRSCEEEEKEEEKNGIFASRSLGACELSALDIHKYKATRSIKEANHATEETVDRLWVRQVSRVVNRDQGRQTTSGGSCMRSQLKYMGKVERSGGKQRNESWETEIGGKMHEISPVRKCALRERWSERNAPIRFLGARIKSVSFFPNCCPGTLSRFGFLLFSSEVSEKQNRTEITLTVAVCTGVKKNRLASTLNAYWPCQQWFWYDEWQLWNS